MVKQIQSPLELIYKYLITKTCDVLMSIQMLTSTRGFYICNERAPTVKKLDLAAPESNTLF